MEEQELTPNELTALARKSYELWAGSQNWQFSLGKMMPVWDRYSTPKQNAWKNMIRLLIKEGHIVPAQFLEEA